LTEREKRDMARQAEKGLEFLKDPQNASTTQFYITKCKDLENKFMPNIKHATELAEQNEK
jgi:hypothetical protein